MHSGILYKTLVREQTILILMMETLSCAALASCPSSPLPSSTPSMIIIIALSCTINVPMISPATLEGYPLHPSRHLKLCHQQSQDSTRYNCKRCHAVCGSVSYKCSSSYCKYQLNVACAVTIKILHRSHPHRLTALRLRVSFICSVCGTDHDQRLEELGSSSPQLFYVCSPCDFLVHPDCALLHNAIAIDQHHRHPLLLFYNHCVGRPPVVKGVCAICHGRSKGDGFYVCVYCDYYAHSKCAISLPHKKVLLREFPNMLRLPVADEHMSVIPYVRDRMIVNDGGGASTSSSADDYTTTTTSRTHDDEKLFIDYKIHEHPLIFRDHHDNDRATLVCNACVGSISSSDSFYECSNNDLCRNFFLHGFCAHLKPTLNNEFHLFSKVDSKAFNIFQCVGCRRWCNGFAYRIMGRGSYVDVVCASMPELITHDAHGKAHVLHLEVIDTACQCCGKNDLTWSTYTCTNCHEFNLHYKCALLPDTVTHKFDRHPLKLITEVTGTRDKREICSNQDDLFCEICEKGIDDRYWYYSCKQCDQSFHIDCIPCVDKLSKIKFGFTIHVDCHDCPLACVRALTVDGYRCGHCQEIIREDTLIAFECSKCYFRIHKRCAEKLVIKS